MDVDIKSQLDRAREIKKELDECCKRDLESLSVSQESRNKLQEILVKVRSTLDQAMYKLFEKEFSKNLSQNDIEKIRVYFPVVQRRDDLKSVLGRANMQDLDKTHQKIFAFIEGVQPYNKNYEWLSLLSRYANQKHIQLIPLKKVQDTRTIVSNHSGSVSWGSGVKFGEGVSVMGAHINPETQDIIPTEGVKSKKETWISFLISGSNVDALWLCEKSISESEKIITDFLSLVSS